MNLYKDIKKIKSERNLYINTFDPDNLTEDELITASKNINLKSIRIHKYLTQTGKLGKVATAKFLSSINFNLKYDFKHYLNENTKIYELENGQIKSIINYCTNK